MKVGFRKSFVRDLKKIMDKALLQRIKKAIDDVENAPDLQSIANLKRLKGADEYLRIRIGDYRVGLKLDGDTVIFIRFLRRKEIYKYFP